MARKYSCLRGRGDGSNAGFGGGLRLGWSFFMGKPVHEDIYDRCRVQRQRLADNQSADHGDAKRPPQFRSRAGTEGQRQAAQQRRHGGHHNRTKTKQTGLINRVHGVLPFIALRLQRKIDHHDAVLLDDADEKNNANERNHAQILVKQHQSQNRPDAGGRKSGKNGDGVNITFIENTQNNINRNQGRQDEQGFVGERGLERGGGAFKRRHNGGRHVKILLRAIHFFNRLSERGVRRKIEGNGDARKLALVVDGQRRGLVLEMGNRAERDRAAIGGLDVNVLQLSRVFLKSREGFHNDVVLIQLREQGRDLPLAKGVVKRFINLVRRNSQARRRHPVNDQRDLPAAILFVGRHVA